jgi:hypothetical protein
MVEAVPVFIQVRYAYMSVGARAHAADHKAEARLEGTSELMGIEAGV